jgi:hypothetical protein
VGFQPNATWFMCATYAESVARGISTSWPEMSAGVAVPNAPVEIGSFRVRGSKQFVVYGRRSVKVAVKSAVPEFEIENRLGWGRS